MLVPPKTQVDGRPGGQAQAGWSPTHAPLTGQETHCPAQHLSKGEQTLPHTPQLLMFVRVSTHCPPQRVVPVGQEHWPPTCEQTGRPCNRRRCSTCLGRCMGGAPRHAAGMEDAAAASAAGMVRRGADCLLQSQQLSPGWQTPGPHCACRFPIASKELETKSDHRRESCYPHYVLSMEGRFPRLSAVP